MHKKSKLPNISEKEATELARACRLALGDHPMDAFIDRAFEEAAEHRRRREESGQLWFPE
ncbi:MAG: hypothetical protein WBS33_17940 [Verrucomicrobiia bacterium]